MNAYELELLKKQADDQLAIAAQLGGGQEVYRPGMPIPISRITPPPAEPTVRPQTGQRFWSSLAEGIGHGRPNVIGALMKAPYLNSPATLAQEDYARKLGDWEKQLKYSGAVNSEASTIASLASGTRADDVQKAVLEQQALTNKLQKETAKRAWRDAHPDASDAQADAAVSGQSVPLALPSQPASPRLSPGIAIQPVGNQEAGPDESSMVAAQSGAPSQPVAAGAIPTAGGWLRSDEQRRLTGTDILNERKFEREMRLTDAQIANYERLAKELTPSQVEDVDMVQIPKLEELAQDAAVEFDVARKAGDTAGMAAAKRKIDEVQLRIDAWQKYVHPTFVEPKLPAAAPGVRRAAPAPAASGRVPTIGEKVAAAQRQAKVSTAEQARKLTENSQVEVTVPMGNAAPGYFKKQRWTNWEPPEGFVTVDTAMAAEPARAEYIKQTVQEALGGDPDAMGVLKELGIWEPRVFLPHDFPAPKAKS